jgi:hypothetical protein
MAYPTKDQFVDLMKTRDHQSLVEEYLLQGTPFAFEGHPVAYERLRETLSLRLQLNNGDITVIGSGRIGFSLDPNKFGAPYTSQSDIDTVIVNSELFDKAWIEMCSIGRRALKVQYHIKQSLFDHRTNNVFYGYVQPERLSGIVSFSSAWFRTFKSLVRVRELSSFDIHGRLYRTWDHVRIHQLYSLNSIATKLSIGTS